MSDFGKLFGPFLGLVGVVGGLDTGSVLLIIGALIYAIALFRGRSVDVVRRTNTDLEERNRQLEATKIELTAENVELRARPSLDKQEKILDKLLEGMTEMTNILREVRTAVVPPDVVRDDD